MKFELFSDIEGISRRAAALFQVAVIDAVGGQGRAGVVLAGGSTPQRLYELLAREYRDGIPWRSLHFFWSDERCVPPDHEDSNYRTAWNSLLSKIPVPEQNIHRIKGELPPHEAARDYEVQTRGFFGLESLPIFDLVLLGMGSDGHTASLFPEAESLREETRLAVSVFVEKIGSWRVTLTLPVLNNSRQIVFLVSGKTKADAFSRIHSGAGRGHHLPASLITPVHGSLTWLVDADAASLIPHLSRP